MTKNWKYYLYYHNDEHETGEFDQNSPILVCRCGNIFSIFGHFHHVNVCRCQFFGHFHRFQSFSFGHLASVKWITLLQYKTILEYPQQKLLQPKSSSQWPNIPQRWIMKMHSKYFMILSWKKNTVAQTRYNVNRSLWYNINFWRVQLKEWLKEQNLNRGWKLIRCSRFLNCLSEENHWGKRLLWWTIYHNFLLKEREKKKKNGIRVLRIS